MPKHKPSPHTRSLSALLSLKSCHAVQAGALLAALASIAGCSSGDPDREGPSLPAGCNGAVRPSSDDQTAVQTLFIEAEEGSTLCLLAGSYSFTSELSITTKGITLRGAGQAETILDFKGQTVGANGLTITGDSVSVEDMTVKNTPGDGIRATDVKDIHFKDVSVLWDAQASVDNGAYGLYPVGSDGVRIESCTVSGARDAGIYVGQSKRILVAGCEVHGNVAGIEIENSSDAEVRDNSAHDNTGGILVFNLPNLPVQDGKHSKVHNNKIEHNNLENFASPGTSVAAVPRGTGLMILASDENEFHDNTITDHDSIGILMLSYSELLFGAPNDPMFNAYPSGNWFHDNKLSGNGTKPDEAVALLVPKSPIPDVVWDGCEDPALDTMNSAFTNCLSDNGAATFQNMDLCKTAGGATTDISTVTCEHATLPAQDP